MERDAAQAMITIDEPLMPGFIGDEFDDSDMGRTLSEGSLKERVQVEEKRILLHVLQGLNGDIPTVSKRLQVSRSCLYSRFQKLDIKRPCTQ